MGKTTGQPLLKNGSTGSDVKKLQQSLIKAGYDVGKTGADGILGKNTKAAIRKYQQDNGLVVDGIAGPKTLNSLYSTGASMGNPRSEPSMVAIDGGGGSSAKPKEDVAEEPPVFNYTQSETVAAANQLLADQWNSMPGAYQSQWTSKINDYMSKIENRDPFSYNFNEDGLYQMYKDHYTQMGQMAMMDTIGQVAAMTGGYGNSYAQTVGQQAYNQQLSQLNNIIPELYQMAYNRYRDEGQDLMNMYNMYMDRENQDYGRYQDSLSNWWRETEYLAGRADTEYDRDYNSQWDSYNAENDAYWKEYDANYQESQDSYNRLAGLISSTGYEPTTDELKAAGMTKEQAKALKDSYTASLNKGNTNNPSNPSDPSDPSYKDLDVGSAAYNAISKAIRNATSLDELEAITQEYLALGYDPAQIKAMIQQKLKELEAGNGPIDTTVPSLDANAGGGGGGRMMIQAW